MILADVMAEVATQLNTITGLRVYPEPPDSIQAPAGIVSYPEVTFDLTFARGADQYELPVIVAVGKVSTRSAAAEMSAYLSGVGAKSVKAVLEAGTYTAFDVLHVSRATVDVIESNGIEYIGATFTCIITGSGD